MKSLSLGALVLSCSTCFYCIAIPSSRLKPRLTEFETPTSYYLPEPEGPGTYAWGYDIEDFETGNIQFRSEEKHADGRISGRYGFMDPNGGVHIYRYEADEKGYRVKEENP